MKLIFNVKITNQRFCIHDRAGWLPPYDRSNIFKYCLHSLSVLKKYFTKEFFYVEVSPELSHESEGIYSTIKQLFPNAYISCVRNNTIADWRREWPRIFEDDSDELILFGGNDDHIFTDYNTDVLESGLNHMRNEKDPYSFLYYSHWFEQCRWSHYKNGTLTDDKDYVKFKWSNFDSIQIFKKDRLKHYFYDFEDDRPIFWRPDCFFEYEPYASHRLLSTAYVPTRPLFNHFDGYSHIVRNVPSEVKQDLNNIAPPLVIPDGFFEKDIKIRIGYNDRKVGWTNLNASAENLFTANPYGADYRWLLDDIPLFWKSHISEIDIAEGYDEQYMRQKRDEYFIKSTSIPMVIFENVYFTENNPPPIDWYQKHMKSK